MSQSNQTSISSCNSNEQEEDFSELFIQVPHWVVVDDRLTSSEFRVMCTLLKFAGSKNVCWPGQKAIAKAVKRSVKQVYNILNSLEKKGFIKQENRLGDTNIYTLFYKVIPKVINRKAIAGGGKQPIADKLYSTNNKHYKGGSTPYFKNNRKGTLPGWVKIGGKWIKKEA